MNLGADIADVDRNAPLTRDRCAQAAQAGVGYVIERGAYSKWSDKGPSNDADNIRSAGMVYGAYVYFTPGVPANDQAQAFKLGARLVPGLDLMAVMDVEFGLGVVEKFGRKVIAAGIADMRKALEDIYGATPILYSSARVTDGNDVDCLAGAANAAIVGMPPWLARYVTASRQRALIGDGSDAWLVEHVSAPPVPLALGGPEDWWFRQYQGDALGLPGFTSTADLNVYHPLSIGGHGTRVKYVQARVGANVEGSYGPLTRTAVIAYQVSKALPNRGGDVDLRTLAPLTWERAAA